jgi:Skp family chaperone for outer membrane proteins
MKRTAGVSWLIAAAAVAGLFLTAYPGKGAPKDAKGGASVGFVDLGLVTDKLKQSQEWLVMVKQFEDNRSKFRTEMTDLTKVRYLSQQERAEFNNLKAKPKPSDSENARIKDLEGKSNKLDQEFQTLAGLEKPTKEQDDRLKEIAATREKALIMLKDEEQKRAQELDQMHVGMLDKQQEKILKIVGQVAQNKDLEMVVDRQLVLYGGQDVTPDVLKKLGG